MDRRSKKIYLSAAVFIFIFIMWELLVNLAKVPLYVLPSPSKIVLALIEDFPALMTHSLVTLAETLLGLAIAFVCGFIIAILMNAFPTFKTAVYPLMVVSQTVPVIVLAPIFIIYLGFGLAPKILIVTLMCFFPIVISFSDAMARTDVDQINLVRFFGASRFQIYKIVKIPGAASALFSGLKVSATYSITGAVVGEWLSSQAGLGYYMLRVKNGFMLDKVFACVAVIVILSLFMNVLVSGIQYVMFPYLRHTHIKNKEI